MPPKRKHGKDLPPNLYLDPKKNGVTYYRWLDPRDGKFKALGTDKASAISDAKALNAIVYSAIAKAQRVESLSAEPSSSPMLSTVIKRHIVIHQARLERGRIKPNTMKARRTRSAALLRLLGDKPLSDIGYSDMSG